MIVLAVLAYLIGQVCLTQTWVTAIRSKCSGNLAHQKVVDWVLTIGIALWPLGLPLYALMSTLKLAKESCRGR